jgi:hypothetical protein
MNPFSLSKELCRFELGDSVFVTDLGSEVDEAKVLDPFNGNGESEPSCPLRLDSDGLTTLTNTMRSAGAQAQNC